MKIFVFGSEIVENDRLAFKVADKILEMCDKGGAKDQVQIVKCTDPEEMLALPKAELEGQDVAVLDVAKGIQNVQPLMIDDLQPKGIFTIHDFNLGMYLKLLQATGEVRNIRIVGIPYGTAEDPESIARKAMEILRV